jgi:peptidyl-prolyl cis-trans isomerase B (cyclophilin B)
LPIRTGPAGIEHDDVRERIAVAGSKRARDLERARYERRQSRKAQQMQRRRKRARIIAAVLAVVVVAGVVVGSIAITNRGGGNDSASTATPSSVAQLVKGCAVAPATPTSAPSYSAAPPESLTAGTTYTAHLDTNCGEVTIDLYADKAPQTVNSFVNLAANGYFTNSPCHRLTTEGLYVLQCGDPTGTGSGGPGYTVPDENLPAEGDNNYPAGTVAMANAGANTGGSQFFLVYKDTTLSPAYTVFGKITGGLDILQNIAAAGTSGTSGDGAPLQPVSLKTVTITTPSSSATPSTDPSGSPVASAQ